MLGYFQKRTLELVEGPPDPLLEQARMLAENNPDPQQRVMIAALIAASKAEPKHYKGKDDPERIADLAGKNKFHEPGEKRLGPFSPK